MLQAKGIHKVYTNGRRQLEVLAGLDLEAKKGEFIAITGPSGAGKSTLLHILGGLDKPTKGKVFVDGRDIYALGDKEISVFRNKRIGFVFQFYHLLPEFTVMENVLMPFLIDKRSARDMKPRALELLHKAGLGQRLGHFPAQLSGGEKQRAAIVRGLINSPEFLLCDEPTGNLDHRTGEEIISLIKGISCDSRMTVVLVTHNAELTRAADHTFRLKDGLLA